MFDKTLALAAIATAVIASQATARDQIRIVGSSTVFPFATTVAERFGKITRFATPVVESTGSGGGLKLFCGGVGTQYPDVTNASRRIKPSEVERCAKNGVTDITEIKIGVDGIAIANSKKSPQMEITRAQLFLALAKDVPAADGRMVPNPYRKWSDIDPSLPNARIEVLGPPPTSGTRDAWAELAMEGGAKKIDDLRRLRDSRDDAEIVSLLKKFGLNEGVWDSIKANKANRGKKAKGKDVFKALAHTIREDGAYIEAGENDNLIIQKLEANPLAFGIFGFSFLDQNSNKVQGAIVEGVSPTFEDISAGRYTVSRSLYFYVKKAHVGVVPGIQEYVSEFTSEKAYGEEGYLADKGLIPPPTSERLKIRNDGKDLVNLSM